MEVDGDLLGLLFIGFGFGLYLVYQGFKLHRQRKLMRNTPTSTVQAASLGPIEVKGVVDVADDLLTAPVSGSEVVFSKYKAEYYDDTGDDEGWDTLVEATETTPFYIEDETGTMRVELTAEVEADISDENSTQTVVRPGDDNVPDAITEFVANHPDIPEHSTDGFITSDKKSSKRRYTEHVIRPDDDVYLFGTVTPNEDDDTDLVLGESSRDMFFVSDREEEELVSDRKWALLWRVPAGATLSAVCAGLLLWVFGVL